ncbi:RelA/SpoT domain-containing protein [Flavobacterium sp.]|uniref:RelA/SpoT domain-containing protein n=1 Tax=Flavobacterium sp. TaxID=239 RepID=UPI00260445FD|nr:RelA/SpoT domain-containing protein [Flavobacterium sp.]MDG2432842.1 RelA/SpoT domain-containing protein [Flavobacterium sp.]
MILSKKKITKAGKILLTSKSQVERDEALDIINAWRTNHLHPLNVMKNSLLRLFNKSGIEPLLVSQRLKRLVSIEYKLDLNENMGLGGMQDIGGYRAVLKDTKDLLRLKKSLANNNNHKLEKVVDYVENPKSSGYRSIHFIYTYNSKNIKYDGLKLELQIRTKLQHNWATAVETAGIITKTSLKSSQGPDEWLEFFKVVSSLFAIKEKQPVLNEHLEKSMVDLMLECEKLAEKLKVTDILKALRVSAKQIEIGKFIGEYYILNINAKEKVVNIKSYKKKQFADASQDYLEIEKTIDPSNNAVVLVSSGSIKSLKKAYPSYFLDTSEFISALEKIIENCKDLK